ncbi:MAG: ketoacyl-ACP synthase III [Chloroflexi bacterium]|nr:ketoacyl-ACP synthase III [Chloroflexota bacterium]
MRYAAIRGWGFYAPDRVLSNFDLEQMVDTSDEWIRERTGISERHIAADTECTSSMSAEAARRALASAGVKASDIDLIIVGSASPDYLFPATACLVQDSLGASKAGAFDLEAGCSSFIYGLSVASQFIAAGTFDNVLVIGAETLSRFVNWKDRRTCVLFGDGAGAVVLGPSEQPTGVLSTVLGADGSGGDYLSLPAGSSRLPASHETVDNGDHFIHMSGNEVFKFAVRIIGDAVEQAIAKAGIRIEDVELFIPHQANIRIIQSAAKRLRLPMEKVFVNVDKYGNTSSASIPIALSEAVASGRVKDGDHLAFVAFGAGLTWASAVVKWGV